MVSTANVVQSLKGIDFPANKQEMYNHAKEHNAPDDVLDVINRLPDREYNNAAEVTHGVSEEKV